MSSLHLQSEVHRNLSRHQPQCQRAARRDPQTDPTKETTVLRRRWKGIITSPLVQVSWCSASEYEGEANVLLDFRQRRFEIQKL